jgi:hypothetical protein
MDAPLFIDEYHATTHLDNVNSCAYYCEGEKRGEEDVVD